ncbi:hypothetical protein [Photorhabdus caribbeanensis]|uniref:hypothetical protein n=1 Tax=Photorhabdus caribbeanensis TaxID=1004165 RepID=UPI001BD4343D|nr:hypothetical protein [Photorhabdus caribbeanensis]
MELGYSVKVIFARIALEGYCPHAADIGETMDNTSFSIMRYRVNKFVSVGNSDMSEILENSENFDAIFLNYNLLFILESDFFREEIYRMLNNPEDITYKCLLKKVTK